MVFGIVSIDVILKTGTPIIEVKGVLGLDASFPAHEFSLLLRKTDIIASHLRI